MTEVRFPKGFLWGAATAAYQVEGSPLADGAGPSIWHRFSHTPGRMVNGDTGDVACDHYHRYAGDVSLMRELGLGAYRFSISWSRILPDGTGRVNEAGLDFYKRLVDELQKAGIRPMATLYHWDLPAALDDRGGWLNRDIAGWFAEYANVAFNALDDRVELWATLNEPWVVVDGGYLHGALAPGHRNLFETPIASHNLLRAHGRAVQAYRANGKHQIGIVVNLEPKYAASESADDQAANERADAYMNRQYLDPIFMRSYPQEFPEMFGEAWPDFPAGDFDTIAQPLDFVGINYYKRAVTQFDPAVVIERARRLEPLPAIYTEVGWEVFPQGLTDILTWFRDRYGNLPLYITENGAAFYDPPAAVSDPVEDPLRVFYLREHLAAVSRAIEEGVDVRGYFVWSLLDNLEWSLGYTKRFGIIHVDFATQKRTFKRSALVYRDVIRTNQ
ncbi:MAG TPA: GH1 family beta-glucosidase [Thermoanaerobaculia bacterium]|jgi:beta-glucosidase|nr:GH1 family beta-glucosidase [Thermoanaerobaculia bacterium]